MLKTRAEFLECFPNCTGSAAYLNQQLLKGSTNISSIHSAIWKFFLVVAPNTKSKFAKSSDFVSILKNKRAEYYEMKEKFNTKPNEDDDSVDPLLATKNSEWSQFFDDQNLREEIQRDTRRTFQELPYFQKQETLTILEDMLFIFCRSHPDYGYPQGLHELAGYILYTYHNEMIADGSDTISYIFHQNAVIPDSYWTFSSLAESIHPLYLAPSHGSEAYSSILANEILTRRLSKFSSELSNHLQQLGIVPQTFMTQWLRLLFLRVFELENSLCVWDLIISELPSLDAISDTCVQMILEFKDPLLSSDSTGAMQLLFHFPHISNPSRLVIKAIQHERKQKVSHLDVQSVVAERLNELAGGLNQMAIEKGWEEALPYIMDLRRTRDILLGVIKVDEVLPLEQALALFQPDAELDVPVEDVPEVQPQPKEEVITQMPVATAMNSNEDISGDLFNEGAKKSGNKKAKKKGNKKILKPKSVDDLFA